MLGRRRDIAVMSSAFFDRRNESRELPECRRPFTGWRWPARKVKSPPRCSDRAVTLAGYKNSDAAKLTKDVLLRNLDIAEKLGCLDDAGLAGMRRGKAATVMKGPYKGDQLSVDHIVPRAVVPELDNVIANLELMPLRMNESKNDKIGDRQRDMAKKFYQAGLLSRKGLEAVQ